MASKVDFMAVFAKLEEKNGEISALKEQIKSLEKEATMLEGKLMEGIKPNEAKGGIRHVVTYRSSVSYAKALEDIKERLVPKTKWPDAEGIVGEYTKISEVHKFKAVGA